MPPQRNFPRRTIDQALRVPQAIREYNGGNPWPPNQVAEALGVGGRTANFFYITTASRDFGFTEGTRDTAQISLTELGRRVVYPRSHQEERTALLEGFLQVDIFKRILEHFGGSNLPERRFLDNTLQEEFDIHPTYHDEFVDLFQKNCRFLGIGSEFRIDGAGFAGPADPSGAPPLAGGDGAVTVATPDGQEDAPVCFVIMPFTERDDRHETGFFEEVLRQVFTPAATAAGFRVQTARRQGSDVIQSTIVNDLLQADLVLADLTEHNPNVLFELGMRMREDRPVALVRARGTGPIFDVDNMLRVEEYNPNLWPSSVDRDVPRIREHIKATWENRETAATFMAILRRQTP
jgi:nucleoside 2-deoxyribosyltransferase